jgi:hypothetical protein
MDIQNKKIIELLDEMEYYYVLPKEIDTKNIINLIKQKNSFTLSFIFLYYDFTLIPINSYYKNETILTYTIKNVINLEVLKVILEQPNTDIYKKNKLKELPIDLINKRYLKLTNEDIPKMFEKRRNYLRKLSIKKKIKNIFNIIDTKLEKINEDIKFLLKQKSYLKDIFILLSNTKKIKHYRKILYNQKKVERNITSLEMYKVHEYETINKLLILNNIPKPINDKDIYKSKYRLSLKILLLVIKDLDKVFRKNKYNKNKYYYRGLTNIDFFNKETKEIITKGYTSITTDKEIAKNFINPNTKCCLLKFKLNDKNIHI